MNRLVPILSILILIAAAYTASAQFQQSSSQSDNETAESYASIPPYLDEAPPKLEKTIHELKGLEPATSQEQLPDILKKAGAMTDGLIQKIPDLASDKAVSQSQRGERNSSQTDQTFTYLLLIHPDQTGALRLQESRTTQKGKPLGQGAGTPNFSGFLSAWLVFSPVHQAESRFRYLGQQQMQGRSTFVVGFAQLPSAASSGKDGNDKNTGRILLQGIAWVDQSDFRIVRLRPIC